MRTAFRVACELETANGRGSITSLAVGSGGVQVYVGDSTGQLCEYRLLTEEPHAGTTTRIESIHLTARKAIGKKPIEVNNRFSRDFYASRPHPLVSI
eukprot:2966936-Pyramimonas_sp.AAC.2